TYQVIAHDGPRTMTSGTINTFSTNIAVQPGDILGLHTATNLTACLFATPPDSYSEHMSDLAEGQSTAFSSLAANDRVNVEAVIKPSNAFSLTGLTRNKKKGTATLNVNLSNPGELTASGSGVKAAAASGAVISKSVGAGPAQLLVKAKGKKKRKLN